MRPSLTPTIPSSQPQRAATVPESEVVGAGLPLLAQSTVDDLRAVGLSDDEIRDRFRHQPDLEPEFISLIERILSN
jgi:hypothetical protein